MVESQTGDGCGIFPTLVICFSVLFVLFVPLAG